jgi:hypothetical protein
VIRAMIVSPAGMLPIRCVKMSDRSCSSSAAVLPLAIACSKRSRACCLRSTTPRTTRPAISNA